MIIEGLDVTTGQPFPGQARATSTAGQVLASRPIPRPGPGFLAGSPPQGLTTVKGAPAPAEVRVLYRPPSDEVGDGTLVASAVSAPDGTWRIDGLNPALEFDVVFRVDGYNDMILSRVKPKAYP